MLYPHSVCEAILYGLDRVNMAKDDPIPGFASIAAEVIKQNKSAPFTAAITADADITCAG